MHRDDEAWRVKGKSGGIIVCTIHERDDAVVVRTSLADGTLLRVQQTVNMETARTIAAQWLDAIRDLVVAEAVTH